MEALFSRFDQALREAGFIAMSGRIVDASLVAAPKQRNSEEEKRRVKADESAKRIWGDKPARASQKDVCARWTLIFGRGRKQPDGTRGPDIAIPFFGYKSHLSIDRGSRFIRKWAATSAVDHDGRMLRRGLIDRSNTASGVWADSTYRSRKNEAFLQKRGLVSHIHRRRAPGKPFPAHMRKGQVTRSKHRAPVEHVFAFQKDLCGLLVRTIGIERARMKIGLANILHNINRLAILRRKKAA